MTQYTCQPALTSVPPCPAGTAPVVLVDSTDTPNPYPMLLDGVPIQDVIFTVAMVLAFLFGIGMGRR